MIRATHVGMGRLRRVCIYYTGGIGMLLAAVVAHADFFEKPGEVASMQAQARQDAAHILSQAYQLSGMKEMTANLAHRYVSEALSQKMSTWVSDAISQVFAEHKGPTLSERLNDPKMKAEMQARIAARLKEEIPKLAKSVVYDKLFQGMLNDADPAAQKMVAHMVDAMTKPLNTQVDAWAQQLTGKAMEKIDPYIKKQLQIGRATISLNATDIRGTIDGVMRLQTMTDMISGPLSEAMGESAFGEMQTRLTDFLHNKLPPELENALYKGPDAVDALIAKGEGYLPTAQLNALKAKMLALPILTIPNEVYGGMLAGSAARHFVLAFAEWPVVNLYELNRGQEVTRVMIWQIKNKQGFNMSLGQLLDMANAALGQVGGLATLGRAGKTIAEAREKFEAVEKKFRDFESKIKNPIERASKEFRTQVDELKQSLLDFQEDLAAPFNEWITAADLGLQEGADQIKALLPDGFNGIPGSWEKIKKKLGIPDKVFGKFGDKSILDNAGIVDAAKNVNDAVSDAMAEFLVDATQTLLPQPEITAEEKIPAQNPDEEGDYDPVLLHNGEFTHPVMDIEIPGRGLNFQFKRTYRSRSRFMGRLGWNWTHNFEEALRTWNSPGGPGLTWIDGDGRKYFFKARIDRLGEFVAPPGVFAELRTVWRGGNKWFELRERGGLMTRFDRAGLLREKCDRFGNCVKCERDASGTLQAVVDTVGRRTQFSHDAVGRITQLADTSGRVWRYEYDVHGDLVRVVSPATDLFPQGIATGYLYDAHRMTQIRDPKGNLFLNNVYGRAGFARGQIVAQSYGGAQNIVKSRYVLLRPAWVVAHWPDTMNVATDRVDLRDRRGVVKRFWHNANGNLLRYEIVDARGRVHPGMRHVYNDDGLRVKEVWPSGLRLESVYYDGGERQLQGLVVRKVLIPLPSAPVRLWRRGGSGRGGSPREYIYSYDSKFGDLISEKSPDGVTKEIKYDTKGSPLTIRLTTGGQVAISSARGGLARREKEIVTKYSCNNYGQIVSTEDPRGTVTALVYDGANLVTVVRDARGRKITTQYAYDTVGNMTSMTLPNGGIRKFDVDAQNLIRREITPMGYERRYDYDPHGNVTAMHVGDYVYQFSYDLLDQLIVKSEPRHAGLDPASRSVDSRVRGNDVTHYSYDPDGRISEVTFPEGNRMRMTYDAWGHLTVVERGAGTRDASFVHYQYDADGNRVGVVDGLGHLTELERNVFGELVASIYPNGTRVEWERDDAGKVVARRTRDQSGTTLAESRVQSDPLGLWRRGLSWDSANNAWRSQELQFDPAGNLLSETNPMGATTHYDTDALGNRTRIRYPETISEEWQYNELGLPILHKIPSPSAPVRLWRRRGQGEGEAHFSYDLQGRLTARVDPNGAITQYSYDDRDNLTQEVFPEGAPVQYGYDGLGRRTSVAQAERVTRYDWDGNGRLRAITDPLWSKTQYAYDAADRLISERYPDRGETRMTYDANGQLTRRCFSNGNCVSQVYDAMGNLVSRQARDVSQSFHYDPMDRLITAQSGDAASHFVYTSLSEVLESAQGINRLQMSYDANGRRSRMQLPDGKTIQWQRDALGRTTQVDGPGGFRATQSWGFYGPEKVQYGNGLSETMTYDAMGSVKGVILSKAKDLSCSRVTSAKDLKGQILRPSQNEGLRMTYQYNLLGNVISQNDTHYTYDPWQQLIQAGDDQWHYNLNGERAQSTNLQFDKNGNMTSDGHRRYIYDALDRLQEVRDENGKTVSRYAYDALNRRISREVEGHATTYVYDGWEPIEIYEDGTLSQQFVRGDGLDDAFGEVGPRYYHKDRLGSITAVSDASGNTVGQYGYDAFGLPSVILNPSPCHPEQSEGSWGSRAGSVKDLKRDSSAAPQNDRLSPRRFTGQLYDAETGLYYMRNRYYSPKLGQFLTRDPLGYKNNFYAQSTVALPFNFSFHQHLGAAPHASLPNHIGTTLMDSNLFTMIPARHNGVGVETNLHMYVGNNPLSATDPLGLYYMRLDRSKNSMTLYAQSGSLVGTWQARTRGQSRNRGSRGGDTPNGLYEIGVVNGGLDYRHEGKATPSQIGLGFIQLKPEEMEVPLGSRSDFSIHSGGSGLANPFTTEKHRFVPTRGCVRMQNQDILSLVGQIRTLQAGGDRNGHLVVYDGALGKDVFNDHLQSDARFLPAPVAPVVPSAPVRSYAPDPLNQDSGPRGGKY